MKSILYLFLLLYPYYSFGQSFEWNSKSIKSKNVKKVFISKNQISAVSELNFNDILVEYEFDRNGYLLKESLYGENFYPPILKRKDSFSYDNNNNYSKIIRKLHTFQGIKIDTIHFIYDDEFVVEYKVHNEKSDIRSIKISLLHTDKPIIGIELNNLGGGYYSYIDYNYFFLKDSSKLCSKTVFSCQLDTLSILTSINFNYLIKIFNQMKDFKINSNIVNIHREFLLYDKESNLIKKNIQNGVNGPNHETNYIFSKSGFLETEEKYIINIKGERTFNLKYFYYYEFW